MGQNSVVWLCLAAWQTGKCSFYCEQLKFKGFITKWRSGEWILDNKPLPHSLNCMFLDISNQNTSTSYWWSRSGSFLSNFIFRVNVNQIWGSQLCLGKKGKGCGYCSCFSKSSVSKVHEIWAWYGTKESQVAIGAYPDILLFSSAQILMRLGNCFK